MLAAFTPLPTADSDEPMPVSSPRAAAASAGGDVLDVTVRQVFAQRLAHLQRILAGDERVARVQVETQIGRVEIVEQPRHEVDVARVRAVGLDIDHDAVVLGPGEALPVVVAGNAEDLLQRHPRRFHRAVDRVDHRTAQFRREADRLLHVLHAEGRAVGPHHRVGAVDLARFQVEALEVLPQRPRVGLKRNGRVIAEGLEEILAVDDGEFDVPHAEGGDLFAGGLETLAQRPPVVGVDANLNHAEVPGKKGSVQSKRFSL